MPSDNSAKKTRPQDKWDAKAGVVAKTYKVNKKIAEEFHEACKKAGIAKGTQITKMMMEFIEEVDRCDR